MKLVNLHIESFIKILIAIFILSVFFYLLKQYYVYDQVSSNLIPEFVGKENCIKCHLTEYSDWKESDHDLSMDVASDSTVIGDFNNAILIRNNQIHKAYKKENKFCILTDGESGKMQEYEVKFVFGHYPLQNYLVEFKGGRLQTIALTWNSKENNWFYMADSVYHDISIKHDNWLHWTNQAQNWNSMCADCHSTNIKKGYNHKTNTYKTTWSEIDVSCEACHGPASNHIDWAKSSVSNRKGISNYGLVVKTSGISSKEYVDNCARCHARRRTLGDFNPHSKNIYDNIIPSLPIEPNWYIDGQIKEEDYVYASFTQSAMYMRGVACNSCHNVHSGKLILEGNALCLQCHKAVDYDTPNHTFHKGYGENGSNLISESGINFEVGSGSECINCHMHGQNYMGVDYRRDHSFRIPRPDLSEENGTPNACNQCHKEKTNKWAADFIVKWYGENRPYQYGIAFSAANDLQNNADIKLRTIINDSSYSPSIRATSITYLSDDPSNNETLKKTLLSKDPVIRIISANSYRVNTRNDVNDLLPLLSDETKAIRIEAVSKLPFLDSLLIPDSSLVTYHKALEEQLQVLEYNSDFPAGKYNFGNYYYKRGDYKKAEQYYLSAIEQDGEFEVAKLNLAILYSAMGEPIKSEIILKKFIDENPNNGEVLYNYGLILSENRKYKKSLKYLKMASELMPSNTKIDYNIAMLYDFFNDKVKAEYYLKSAIKKDEGDIASYVNLMNFYINNNNKIKADILLKTIQELQIK